jgi:hypothetical protein
LLGQLSGGFPDGKIFKPFIDGHVLDIRYKTLDIELWGINAAAKSLLLIPPGHASS